MDVLHDPDLITIKEAARLLGIKPARAYQLLRDRQLPGAVLVGGRWRVSIPRYRREVHGDSHDPIPKVIPPNPRKGEKG
jgi:excisionase family DNA binding protein